MDGSNLRNSARFWRLTVEELEGRIVLSTAPVAGTMVPAPATSTGPVAGATQPVNAPAGTAENYVAVMPGANAGAAKAGRHVYNQAAPGLSSPGSYRPDPGDHPGEPDDDAAQDQQEALIRQVVSAQLPQTNAPDGEASSGALAQGLARPEQETLVAALNPDSLLAGFVPPGKADAAPAAATTVASRALATAITASIDPGDTAALWPLASMPTMDAQVLGPLFAEAFRTATATDWTDALPSMLPALVAPVSFSLLDLRQQVDGFFARLAQGGETGEVLANSVWVVPWLMVVSAVAFEFARQRSQAPTPDACLFPPGVRSFEPEVRDDG